MNRAFLFSLLCFLVLPAFSQWSYNRSDSSLWDSPLSADKILQYNIKRITVKERKFRRPPRIERRLNRSFKGQSHSGVLTKQQRKNRAKVRFRAIRTFYEFDSFGYPLRISIKGQGKNENYTCKNEYKNGALIRSEFANLVFTAHYNNEGLRDTCTWIEGGESVYQKAYLFDSLHRVIQSDVFIQKEGTLKLSWTYLVEYNEKNRPLRLICIVPAGSPQDSYKVTKFETEYNEDSKNAIMYRWFDDKKDTDFVISNIYLGKGKRRITEKSCPSYCTGYRYQKIEKISKQSGKYRHYAYECCIQGHHLHTHHVYHLTNYVLSDVSSGFILKHARLTPRSLILNSGRIRLRRLLSRKTHITTYSYRKNKEKPLQE